MIEIEIRGISALERVLQNFGKFRNEVNNRLLPQLAKEHKKQIQTRIRTTKKSPDEERWPGLKIPKKEGSLLVTTGAMARGWRMSNRSRRLQLRSITGYAGFQHFGTRYIPKREFAGFGRNDLRGLERVLQSWATRRFEAIL